MARDQTRLTQRIAQSQRDRFRPTASGSSRRPRRSTRRRRRRCTTRRRIASRRWPKAIARDFDEMRLPMPELFTFKADDGKTDLYGVLYKPSDFDPTKKYPLVIDVYGGPLSQGVQNRFAPRTPRASMASSSPRSTIAARSTAARRSRARRTCELGEKDMKDQADGVRLSRPAAIRRRLARRHLRPFLRRLHVGPRAS